MRSRVLVDDVELGEQLVGRIAVLHAVAQDLHLVGDDPDRVVDLVADAGGERADRSELLAQREVRPRRTSCCSLRRSRPSTVGDEVDREGHRDRVGEHQEPEAERLHAVRSVRPSRSGWCAANRAARRSRASVEQPEAGAGHHHRRRDRQHERRDEGVEQVEQRERVGDAARSSAADRQDQQVDAICR
jgi:hypothetical protein